MTVKICRWQNGYPIKLTLEDDCYYTSKSLQLFLFAGRECCEGIRAWSAVWRSEPAGGVCDFDSGGRRRIPLGGSGGSRQD